MIHIPKGHHHSTDVPREWGASKDWQSRTHENDACWWWLWWWSVCYNYIYLNKCLYCIERFIWFSYLKFNCLPFRHHNPISMQFIQILHNVSRFYIASPSVVYMRHEYQFSSPSYAYKCRKYIYFSCSLLRRLVILNLVNACAFGYRVNFRLK